MIEILLASQFMVKISFWLKNMINVNYYYVWKLSKIKMAVPEFANLSTF